MTHRTESYQATVANDMYGSATIAAIREGARAFNRNQKALSLTIKDPNFVRLTKRVDVFGRLGKNNQYADLYRQRKFCSAYGNPYQRIRPEHSVAFDVYVTLKKWQGGGKRGWHCSDLKIHH